MAKINGRNLLFSLALATVMTVIIFGGQLALVSAGSGDSLAWDYDSVPLVIATYARAYCQFEDDLFIEDTWDPFGHVYWFPGNTPAGSGDTNYFSTTHCYRYAWGKAYNIYQQLIFCSSRADIYPW